VTRLLLIRHAQPEEDARGRCYGRLDVGLSREGEAAAERLADGLRPVEREGVYSSPRRRAVQTASRIGPPRLDERLCEIDFGELEGRTYEEVERERPELYRRWMESPTQVRFPGGESWADLRARVANAVADMLAANEGATIAVVTHGGVVRAVLADALGLPDERAFALDVGYARISVVDWFDSTAVVRLVNGVAADLPGALGS
jgi:alpha-ribazole phosphatase/probable phosphoglycerate mutase